MAIVENTQFGRVGAFRFWCQKVLPAVYDDSLSYYELLCKVMKWLTDLTDVTNEQSDAITELQETLAQFMEGEFDPYIEEKVDEWFEENEPDLLAEIAAIKENADKVPGIEEDIEQLTNDLDYVSKHVLNSYSNSGLEIFVNDLTGDDDNDGLTDATAVKTVEKALSFIDEGYNLLYVRIRSNGVYYVNRKILANCTVHFNPSSTVSDVSIYWANDADFMYFYNCYIHFSNATTNVFKNYFPNGFHFDASGLYASNVYINASRKFDASFSVLIFDNCTIVTNNYLRIDQCNLKFSGVNNFTIDSNGTLVYAISSHVSFIGTFNIISNGDDISGVNMLRFDECFVNYTATTNYVNSLSNKYGCAIAFVRSFATISQTVSNTLTNCGITGIDGNYSVIQNYHVNTVFNGE